MERSNKILFLVGFAALFSGALFYIISRPNNTYLNQFITAHLIFIPDAIRFPAFLQDSFPAFIHPFSFSLITIGILAETKFDRIMICSIFLIVNLVFEIGQYFKEVLVFIKGYYPPFPVLYNFFSHGTYSHEDIIFIIIGSLTAYVTAEIILRGYRNEERMDSSF